MDLAPQKSAPFCNKLPWTSCCHAAAWGPRSTADMVAERTRQVRWVSAQQQHRAGYQQRAAEKHHRRPAACLPAITALRAAFADQRTPRAGPLWPAGKPLADGDVFRLRAAGSRHGAAVELIPT